MIPAIDKPENPLNEPVLLIVIVVPVEEVKVSVPVPESVPLRLKGRLLLPLVMVGLLPSGKLQSLPIVVPPLPFQLILTRLKV